MLHNYLSLLPEVSLAVCLPVMALVNRFREENTPKTFFTLSKSFLLVSLFAVILFYNRSAFPAWLVNNPFTSLFKIIVCLFTLAWFYLSCKWFLNKNRSSFGFYSLGILVVLGLNLAISSVNLLLTFVCLWGAFLLNYYLIRLRDEEDETVIAVSRRFLFFAVLFGVFFAAGIWLLWTQTGSFGYDDLYNYYALSGAPEIRNASGEGAFAAAPGIRAYAAMGLIIAAMLFLLAVAPFHFWYADVIGVSVLPVSGFLTIVPVFAYVACLADLVLNIFLPAYPVLRDAVVIFGVLSLVIGVLNANIEQNMRRLFAYSALYHTGVILLTLSAFNENSLLSGFVYMLVYVLAMSGIYTAFLGFRSQGAYLRSTSSIAGISTVRPYISAAVLIFLLSLIATPPMLGFLGRLSVVNNLVIQGSYGIIFIILLSVLMLIYAYLKIIKSMYFDSRTNIFDRADKGVYICLFINLVLVLISILNPRYLMHDFEAMLVTIF